MTIRHIQTEATGRHGLRSGLRAALAAFLAVTFQFAAIPIVAAQTADSTASTQSSTQPALQISWEVRNRFRLFREERDFLLHTETLLSGSILASEQALATRSEGRGWSRNTVGRLCIDPSGRVMEPCTRDGVNESYLTPSEHSVTVRLTGAAPVGATCAWTFDGGDGPHQSTLDCAEPVNLRARYGRITAATVDIFSSENEPQRIATNIEVRDVFIAGLGDSIASGEGNPDRPVALSDDGFCFQSYLGGPGSQYFRPARANFKGSRACETGGTSAAGLRSWQALGARWFNAACHRSLYSYQTRAALALAADHPHIAVTYLPLACTGATINEGLFGPQRARECLFTRNTVTCTGNINAQLTELREALSTAKRRQPSRQLDLVLLSIGANDIDFSGLVADIIVKSATERALFRRTGVIGALDDSRTTLQRDLPRHFARLRTALKPLVGDLSRVVYVSYGNPALADGAPCPGGPAGFDIHPSFDADPARLQRVTAYVQDEFLPLLKDLALCQSGVLCRDPDSDRMTFVDRHQQAFANHGFCARGASDPDFDQQCFSAKGDSFNSNIVAASAMPMACGRGASEFRAYLPRARWVRDANDSYFAAMTYPQGVSSSALPSDVHDATWGVLSAVYGGAIHPTAEGHAAMADAALPAMTDVLGLHGAKPQVTREPLPPASLLQ